MVKKQTTVKIVIRLLAIWGCIATLPLIYFVCVYLDREGIVEFRRGPSQYYYPADLQRSNLPSWNLTNAIPLSPDAAVKAATAYAAKKHPGINTWDVEQISLDHVDSNIWKYEIDLIDRQSGSYNAEYVRVLLDGSIWEPTSSPK